MKIRLTALALIASATLAAGCGSDDTDSTTSGVAETPATIAEIDVETGPFESDEAFVSEVSAFCEQAREVNELTPVYGVSAAGLEAGFTTLLENEREDLAKTESTEAAPPRATTTSSCSHTSPAA